MSEEYDNFGIQPGYRDLDAAATAMRKAFEAIPEEQHHKVDDAVKEYLRNPTARAVLGQSDNSAVLIDDPMEFAQIAAANNIKANLTPGADTSSGVNSAAVPKLDEQVNAASAPAPLSKPSDIENQLGGMQLSPSRQKRFVLTGDPEIIQRFYNKLAQSGLYQNYGGVPYLGISRTKAVKLLNEIASDMNNGSKVQHALSLSMERESITLTGKLAAGVKNLLGRHDQVDVVVVGKQDVVDKQLTDLGKVLNKMQGDNFFKDSNAVKVDDTGKLQVAESKPLTLKGNDGFYELVSQAQATVAAYRRQEDDKSTARRDFRNDKDDQAILASKKTESSTASTATVDTPTAIKPNAHTAALANEISGAMTSPGKLHEQITWSKDGKEFHQELAVSLLKRSANIQDPVKPEIATLPAEDRHALLANLLALTAKAADKEFGSAGLNAVNDTRNGDSLQTKLVRWIADEMNRDPAAAGKIADAIQGLQKEGVLSEAQATTLASSLRPVSTQTDTASSSKEDVLTAAKPAQAETASLTPTKSTEASPVSGSTVSQPAASLSSTEVTKVDSQTAIGAATSPTVVVPDKSATDSSAKPLSPVDAVAAVNTSNSALSSNSLTGSSTGSNLPPVTAVATSAVSEPVDTSLKGQLSTAVANGVDKMTEQQASSMLAALDAIRTKPLSSLDAGTGAQPTKTLGLVEAVLKESESGRLGPVVAAQADDLRSAVSSWRSQDDVRLIREGTRAIGGGSSEAVSPSASASEMRVLNRQSGSASDAATSAQPGAQKVVADAPPVVVSDAVNKKLDTSEAAGKLASLMANPARSFTNDDKTWNEKSIQTAVAAVQKLDLSSVAELKAPQRTTLAAYATWLADNAGSGKLPGFEGDSGKQNLEALTTKAQELISQAGGKLPASVEKELTKADNMVATMVERQQSNTAVNTTGNVATVQTASRQADGADLAKELISHIYGAAGVSEDYAKLVMKNADKFTPQALSSLSGEDRAKATISLDSLATTLKDGALGDFNQLPAGLRNNINNALKAVEVLESTYAREPGMAKNFDKAQAILEAGGDARASAGSTSDSNKTNKGSDALTDATQPVQKVRDR